jgi:hypothetical protein
MGKWNSDFNHAANIQWNHATFPDALACRKVYVGL